MQAATQSRMKNIRITERRQIITIIKSIWTKENIYRRRKKQFYRRYPSPCKRIIAGNMGQNGQNEPSGINKKKKKKEHAEKSHASTQANYL